jgi:hypothetical protein
LSQHRIALVNAGVLTRLVVMGYVTVMEQHLLVDSGFAELEAARIKVMAVANTVNKHFIHQHAA